MYYIRFHTVFFICSLLFSANIQAQQKEEMILSQILDQASSLYGLDDALVNGLLFLPGNINAAGDPYFLGNGWKSAFISVNERIHSVEAFKYDICDERLILLVTLSSGSRVPVILNNDFILWFSISNHSFIQAGQYFAPGEMKGFVDLIYEGNISFLSKHKKEFVNMYTQVTPFGKFSETKVTYYLIKDKKAIKIKNKRSLLSAFETNRKEINRFIKTNNIHFRKATHSQLMELAKYCDDVSRIK
jgi:hypothetical protein